MTEVSFIRQNHTRWKSLEQVLTRPAAADPDFLAENYMLLSDDLAYAQTFFPKSKTTIYLNSLAVKLYALIYRNKKEPGSRLLNFWTTELPLLMVSFRTEGILALILMLISVAIGLFSGLFDSDFPTQILGESYIRMTLDNINNGTPLAVYDSNPVLPMFLSIAFNNLFVSVLVFVSGVIAGIGTVYYLISNGIMIGAFLSVFLSQKVNFEGMAGVWIHGTLEISCIILAGAAGLQIGRSLLFPGTFPRGYSFKTGVKNGLKLTIGVFPLIILAAVLESALTRFSGAGLWLSVSVMVLTGCFVLGYFVLYPWFINTRRSHDSAGN